MSDNTAARLVILIVDDELAVLHTLSLVLQSEGYTVMSTATAEDALRLLSAFRFDLVMIDCIPNHSQVVRETKRRNSDTRIAICTGNSLLTDSPTADVVLHKPISPPDLLKSIANLLATSGGS